MNKMISRPVTRRRALFIGAALVGSTLMRSSEASIGPVRWSGQALGAHAQIQLFGVRASEALPIFKAVEGEIERLERIFSLFRAESALARLNATGSLSDPPPELLEVLGQAEAVHDATDGLFDPTVQPLFAFYADYFTRRTTQLRPDAHESARALSLVGFRHVDFDTGRIAYRKPGMAITLNGIAQGYITDRVAALLRSRGFSNMLLDIGEISAIGGGLDGEGWRVGLKKAPDSADIAERLRLSDKAVATSMMLGTTLDGGGTVGHILHPRLGLVERYNARASVVHASATHADALSTAAILMNAEEIAALRARGARLYI